MEIVFSFLKAMCCRHKLTKNNKKIVYAFSYFKDRLCCLLVRVHGYRSRGVGSIPGTTRFSEK
jgi:hypothetical protein